MRVTTPPWDAGRWSRCPASALIRAKYPQARTFEKDEGSAAHWAAEMILKNQTVYAGMSHGGVEITPGIMGHVDEYIDSIMDVVGEQIPAPLDKWVSEVEGRLDMHHIHPDQYPGKADYWAWEQFGDRALHVWDFKYGRTIVNPRENYQLICAVSSIVERYKPNIPEDFPVYLHLCQPRAYSTGGVWETTWKESQPYIDKLKWGAAMARIAAPPYTVGTWCRNCNGLPYCPGAREAAIAAFEFSGFIVPDTLQESPNAMAVERALLTRALETIKYRLGSVDDYLLAKLQGGEQVNGLRIGHTRGHRAWTVDAQTVITTGEFSNLDLAKPREAITPAQAISAGLPENIVNGLTCRKPGSVRIEEEDPDLARRVFGGNEI